MTPTCTGPCDHLAQGEYGGAFSIPNASWMDMLSVSGTTFPKSGTLSYWFYDNLPSPPMEVPIMDIFNSSRNHFEVISSGSTVDKAAVYIWNKATAQFDIGVPFSVNRSVWNHVVMTWQTGANPNLTLYINGTNLPISNAIPSATWVPDGQVLQFGATYPGLIIDEVELYNRPLTPAEINHVRTLPH